MENQELNEHLSYIKKQLDDLSKKELKKEITRFVIVIGGTIILTTIGLAILSKQ